MYEIMVSGYGGGDSISIAKYLVSDDWKVIEEVWNDNIASPSYLSIEKDLCFALAEVENKGTLVCYKKDVRGYIRMDSMAVDGCTLCYVQYSPRHKTLFGASYKTGHVVAAAIESCKFAGLRSFFAIQPDNNDDISRAHCCVPDHTEDRIFVCNISLDRVYVYNIENGVLKENEPFRYLQLEKGEGPRHIRFHPEKDIAYIITEYSNNLLVLSYDKLAGVLDVIQKVSTLPEGFPNESYGSSLTLSPDGKYLYASNRGANTIAIFSVNDQGMLKKLQDFDCCGNWPRHIDITADGRYLMIANQRSGNLAVVSVSIASGRLERYIADIPFNAPSYVSEMT